jgi:hypothetical protein
MIDDVDYLIKNSIEQSVTIYADSTLRNKLHYPYPNNYVITFDQPIKNVFGFEVIDGAMPNTMFNVDIYNNDVYFSTINVSTTDPVNPSNYFQEIITCNTFINAFNNDDKSFFVIGTYTQLSPFISNNTTITGYYMYIRNIWNNAIILLKTTQIADEYYFFTYNNIDYIISNIYADIINILKTNEFNLQKNSDGTFNIVYFNVYNINLTTYTNINTSNKFLIAINNYHVYFDVGNYDIITITNNLNDLFNTYSIDLAPTSQPPILKASMTLTSTNYFILNTARGKLLGSLGFDSYPMFTANASNFNAITIGTNIQVFGAVVDPTVTTATSYILISPGVINLLGERFIILNIEELNDHMLGSYSYMSYTPGIGLFKTSAASGGITNLRFDFISLIRKPFHPIGKLSKLTLQFLTKDGNPYDFKGINHQLLFSIKFRVPAQKNPFTKSILNPNYNPNIMQYLKDTDDKEQSDDEKEFDDEKHYQTYKKELDKYDYSTSSGDSSSGSESEEAV